MESKQTIKILRGANMNTKIYSIFPACGKTWLYEHQDDYGLKILDSDSSQFSWIYRKRTAEELEEEKRRWESVPRLLSGDAFINQIKNGEIKARNPDFPNNYINHIKDNIGKYDCIFVSSHASVREALDAEGIDFTIVYPESNCKAEWVGRCFIRDKNGESGCGAEAMYNNWDQWNTDCFMAGVNHKEIVLSSNEYLSDYFNF
jgi:hypothetical protein